MCEGQQPCRRLASYGMLISMLARGARIANIRYVAGVSPSAHLSHMLEEEMISEESGTLTLEGEASAECAQ